MKNNQIADFPAHIIKRMLDCQEEQGNPRDVTVFEKSNTSDREEKGFDWDKTKEGEDLWSLVIFGKKFHLIPNAYPRLMEIPFEDVWQKRVVVFERKIGNETYYYHVPGCENMEEALLSPLIAFTNSAREIKEK